jgi:hypothetical protein
MVFVCKAIFQHGDGSVDPALVVDWLKEKAGTQAFAASFPAVRLGLAVDAIARLAFDIGSFGPERRRFQRGRTRAACLCSFAMSQRANQTLETTSTAVTDRADARSAPSAAVSHL